MRHMILNGTHQKALETLFRQPVSVLEVCCKLAYDFIRNGLDNNKFKTCSQRLSLSLQDVQEAVYGLIYLMIVCRRDDYTENELCNTLANCTAFDAPKRDVLSQFYERVKPKLIIDQLGSQDMPSYQDLRWRFEVLIASRSEPNQLKPSVTLDLILQTPHNKIHTTDKLLNGIKTDSCIDKLPDYMKNIVIDNSVDEAKTAAECENVISHCVLSCDLPNLINITSKLEEAVNESRTQFVRKMQRNLH